jgi:hypothetical protein
MAAMIAIIISLAADASGWPHDTPAATCRRLPLAITPISILRHASFSDYAAFFRHFAIDDIIISLFSLLMPMPLRHFHFRFAFAFISYRADTLSIDFFGFHCIFIATPFH